MTWTLERVVIRSDLAELDRVFRFTAEFCRHNGISKPAMDRLMLVIEELVVNILEHGAQGSPDERIEISLSGEEDAVTLSLEDDTPPFDPLANVKDPAIDLPLEERAIGGLGLFLVTRLTEHLEYRYVNSRNVITVVIRNYQDD